MALVDEGMLGREEKEVVGAIEVLHDAGGGSEGIWGASLWYVVAHCRLVSSEVVWNSRPSQIHGAHILHVNSVCIVQK